MSFVQNHEKNQCENKLIDVGWQPCSDVSTCLLKIDRATRLLLVKFYDNKMVKSPYNCVIYLLTQTQVAYEQQQQKMRKISTFVTVSSLS